MNEEKTTHTPKSVNVLQPTALHQHAVFAYAFVHMHF